MNNVIKLTKMSLKNLNAVKKFAFFSIIAVVLAVFFVSEGNQGMSDADSRSIYLLMIINLMGYVFTYMIMAYEEISNIDILVACLPVEKKDFIKSRYVLGIIGILLGLVIFFAIIFAKNMISEGSIVGNIGMNNILELAGMGILCAIFTISIIIPAHIGYGGFKGRIIAIIGFMMPMFAGTAISKVVKFPAGVALPFSAVVIVASMAILLISYKVAMVAYKKKSIV